MIRVLVVDDDYHVARAHALSIARIDGFTAVAEAHTGEEAQRLVEELEPDLLLLDMYLPDFSGLDLVRRLAANGHRVPDFLLVTAARDLESVRAAMQLGAFYYLVKPFTFAALREQLEAYRAWTERLRKAPGTEGDVDQDAVAPGQRGAQPAADDGTGPGDRQHGARAGRRRRGRRDPGGEPTDRPALPRHARQEAAPRPRPQLWHDRAPRAPIPATTSLTARPTTPAPGWVVVGIGAVRAAKVRRGAVGVSAVARGAAGNEPGAR